MTAALNHDDVPFDRSAITGGTSQAVTRPAATRPGRRGRDDRFAQPPARRWLVLCLGGWGVGTLVLAASATIGPIEAPAPGPEASRSPSHTADHRAITERPLFARTRHPVAVPIFVAPAPPPRDHDIHLKGVFRNGGEARAFLTSSSDPQGRWLAPNETLAGWTIGTPTSENVRLTADGETLTVSLHPAGQGAPPPPRLSMPMPPRPMPVLPSPANAAAVEPGMRPDLQEMRSAATPGILGMSAKPGAKAP